MSIEQEPKTEAEPDPTGHSHHKKTMMIVGEGDNYHDLPTYIPKLIKQYQLGPKPPARLVIVMN